MSKMLFQCQKSSHEHSHRRYFARHSSRHKTASHLTYRTDCVQEKIRQNKWSTVFFREFICDVDNEGAHDDQSDSTQPNNIRKR